MPGRFRRYITHTGATAEELVERLRRRRRHSGPIQIIPYRGFGTADSLSLSGRVLEDRGILPAHIERSRLANFRDNWRRFGSRELVGVRVRATLQAHDYEAITDDEGYFALTLKPEGPLDGAAWQIVRLELLDRVIPNHAPVRAAGEVLVPPPSARFGVISDIDDTILQTYATDLLKMLRLTMFRNAHTRLPFSGVAPLYQAFEAGKGGSEKNPIFYVSSSPWNIYDFLVEFIAFQGLPAGPLLLTDYGIDRNKLLKQSHSEHKLAAIERILGSYPRLPFVLIGDSGQHDPEIYLTAVRRFPGRIAAIYIRHVSDSRRAVEVAALAGEANSLGVIMLLAGDSSEVDADARRRGLI